MIYDVICSVLFDYAVMSRSLFAFITADKRSIDVFGRLFFEFQLSQIGLFSVRIGLAKEILFVLIAVPRISDVMIVAFSEIKRALNGMPVLTFTETVVHEYFFV